MSALAAAIAYLTAPCLALSLSTNPVRFEATSLSVATIEAVLWHRLRDYARRIRHPSPPKINPFPVALPLVHA